MWLNEAPRQEEFLQEGENEFFLFKNKIKDMCIYADTDSEAIIYECDESESFYFTFSPT